MSSPGTMASDHDITRTPEYHMYAFKILSCPLKTSHDWSSCSWAHPKEQARRRDPRRFYYTPVMCPYAKMGAFACPKGDACDMAHQVYEYWLHPLKFRSEMCRKGPLCDRRLCFFAHRPEELRAPTPEQLINAGMMAPPPGAVGVRPGGSSTPLPPMMEDAPAGGGEDGGGGWDEDQQQALLAAAAGGAGPGGPMVAQLMGAEGLLPPSSMGDVLLGGGGEGPGGPYVDAGQHAHAVHATQRMLLLGQQQGQALQRVCSMDTGSTFSSSSALLHIGGSGSFTQPGSGMGGGSFTHPNHGMGGGSFTHPGPGMSGGSFTHSVGGGSFTHPGPGMGGGSFTHPGPGMGNGSFTQPGPGMGGGSFTQPGPGMGGGSFTQPGPGMGGGSFTHPQLAPLQQLVQRQLSFGAPTSPAFAVVPSLHLQQQQQAAAAAAAGAAQQMGGPLLMVGHVPGVHGGQYAAALNHASLRAASFTSDTSSVGSMDVGGHGAGAGGQGNSASAPLPVRAGLGAGAGAESLSAPRALAGGEQPPGVTSTAPGGRF